MGVDEEVERSINETHRLLGIFADMKKRSAEIVARKNEMFERLGVKPEELEEVFNQKRSQLGEETRVELDRMVANFEEELERESDEAADRFRKEVLLRAEQLKKVGRKRLRNMI